MPPTLRKREAKLEPGKWFKLCVCAYCVCVSRNHPHQSATKMSIIPNLQQFVVVRLRRSQSTGGCFGGFAANLGAVRFFIPNSYKSLCVCLCVPHLFFDLYDTRNAMAIYRSCSSCLDREGSILPLPLRGYLPSESFDHDKKR